MTSAPENNHEPNDESRFVRVLDHGFVRLVDSMGGDTSIVRSARVSYDAAWRAGEDEGSDTRLIRYLWNHGHTTPFEAVTLTFEVYAPIFVLRQWHRHRTWSFNELSGRYRQLPDTYYVPSPHEIGVQSTDNKQVRLLDDSPNFEAQTAIENACYASFRQYEKLIADGVPRELARIVLPLATYSHMFATVNLLNLFKFIRLRDHDHAQREIRAYAQGLLQLTRQVAPVAVSTFEA